MEQFELLIVGYGVSGRSAASLAAFLGKKFAVLDERRIDEDIPGAAAVFAPWNPAETPDAVFDVAVLSPGVRAGSPLFQMVSRVAGHLESELEFAASVLPEGAIYAAITGTNGKTTTTELTAALFRAVGRHVRAAGNIGFGMCDAALEVLRGELDGIVAEVSSFQLEWINSFPAEGAAVLNLASDHIDRHGSLEEYARIKFKLASLASAGLVLNAGLADLRRQFAKHETLPVMTFSAADNSADFTLQNGWICYHCKPVLNFADARLKGDHNAENMMAALALVMIREDESILARPQTAETLLNFAPDGSRMETFLEIDGITCVDDSKATNPHAVNAALDSFRGRPVRLLLGGLDKDMDFTELVPHLHGVVQAYIAGACRQRVYDAVGKACPCKIYNSFSDAVAAMCADAERGDVILLSPATASMDEFKNYRERGLMFQRLVQSNFANR